jgi:FAD/FMN-containing dehydrogenase
MSDVASIVQAWQARFEGQLLTCTDGNYEASRRIWNGMIDRRPSVIARCASSKDVRLAVKLARTERMQVSVRGGGHGVAGTAVCDGGLMIDLSLLKEIRVDPFAREATAALGRI